jgi:uncharacterized protein YbbK (DUF523 family)
MIIVSACLAGIRCRYNGEASDCQKVIELVKQGRAIPVCPEHLGGLPTPREPAEQKNGKIFTISGKDVTSQFAKGAQETLRIAKLAKCDKAIFKSKSPSCGSGKVFDGTFSGRLVDGDGITTKILKENGIKVVTENDI